MLARKFFPCIPDINGLLAIAFHYRFTQANRGHQQAYSVVKVLFPTSDGYKILIIEICPFFVLQPITSPVL